MLYDKVSGESKKFMALAELHPILAYKIQTQRRGKCEVGISWSFFLIHIQYILYTYIQFQMQKQLFPPNTYRGPPPRSNTIDRAPPRPPRSSTTLLPAARRGPKFTPSMALWLHSVAQKGPWAARCPPPPWGQRARSVMERAKGRKEHGRNGGFEASSTSCHLKVSSCLCFHVVTCCYNQLCLRVCRSCQ